MGAGVPEAENGGGKPSERQTSKPEFGQDAAAGVEGHEEASQSPHSDADDQVEGAEEFVQREMLRSKLGGKLHRPEKQSNAGTKNVQEDAESMLAEDGPHRRTHGSARLEETVGVDGIAHDSDGEQLQENQRVRRFRFHGSESRF